MKKQRRLTFQEALNKLQTTSENDNDSDEEITNGSESVFASNCLPESASDCLLDSDSASDGDELPPEEVLFDIDVFEEESDEDYEISSNDGQESNDESSENKDQEEITAGSATYYAQPFQSRLRRKNILIQRARIDANLDCEINAFKLCYRPEIIFLIVRETCQKARDVRHQYGLLPNLVYKNFTIKEVEAGIAIMICAGLDRDNFTGLRRLWDPIESRPFY